MTLKAMLTFSPLATVSIWLLPCPYSSSTKFQLLEWVRFPTPAPLGLFLCLFFGPQVSDQISFPYGSIPELHDKVEAHHQTPFRHLGLQTG